MAQGTHVHGGGLCGSRALLYSLSLPIIANHSHDEPHLLGILTVKVVARSHALIAFAQKAMAVSGFAAEVGPVLCGLTSKSLQLSLHKSVLYEQVNISLADAVGQRDALHAETQPHARDSLHAAEGRCPLSCKSGASQHAHPAQPKLPAKSRHAHCSSTADYSPLHCPMPGLQHPGALAPAVLALCTPDQAPSHPHDQLPIAEPGSQPGALLLLAIVCAAQAALLLVLLVRGCNSPGAGMNATAGEPLHENARETAADLTPVARSLPMRAASSSGRHSIGWCLMLQVVAMV